MFFLHEQTDRRWLWLEPGELVGAPEPHPAGLGELLSASGLSHGGLTQGDSPRLPQAASVAGAEAQGAGVEMVTLLGPLPARDAGPDSAAAAPHESFVRVGVGPVREPDALNAPVRFDERGVETEHGTLLGHRQPKGPATRKARP